MRMIIICYSRLQKGPTMRSRQEFWLDWLVRVLVALGVVTIAAVSVLIAWMSLDVT